MIGSSSARPHSIPVDHFWKRVGQWSLLSFKMSVDVGANLLNLIPYGLLAPIYRKLYQRGWHKLADALKLTSIPMTVILLGGVLAVLSQLTLAVAVTSLFAPALIFGGIMRLPLMRYQGEWGIFIRRVSEATTRGLLLGLAIGMGLEFASVYYPPLMFSPWVVVIITTSLSGVFALLRRSRAAWAETKAEVRDVEAIDARIEYIQDYQFSERFRASLITPAKIKKVLGLQTLKIAEQTRATPVLEILERDYAQYNILIEFNTLDINYQNLWKALKSAAKEFDYFAKDKSRMVALRQKFDATDEKAILGILSLYKEQPEISAEQYKSMLSGQLRKWFDKLLIQVPEHLDEIIALNRVIQMRTLSAEVIQIGKKVAQRVREDFTLEIEPGYREHVASLLKTILTHDLVEQLKDASAEQRLGFVKEQKRIGQLLVDESKATTSYNRLINFLFKERIGQFFFERFQAKEIGQFPAFEHTQYFLRLISQCLNADPTVWSELVLMQNINQQLESLYQIRQQKHDAFAALDERASPILAKLLSDEVLLEQFDFALERKILSLALNPDARLSLSDALVEFDGNQDRAALLQKTIQIAQELKIEYALRRFMQRCSDEYGHARFTLIKPKLDLLGLTQGILSNADKAEFFDDIDGPLMDIFYNALTQHLPEAPFLRVLREQIVFSLKREHSMVAERINYYPELRGIAEKYNQLYQGVINRKLPEANQEISFEVLKEAIDFVHLYQMLSNPNFEAQFEAIAKAVEDSYSGLFLFGTELYKQLVEANRQAQVYTPMSSSQSGAQPTSAPASSAKSLEQGEFTRSIYSLSQ